MRKKSLTYLLIYFPMVVTIKHSHLTRLRVRGDGSSIIPYLPHSYSPT